MSADDADDLAMPIILLVEDEGPTRDMLVEAFEEAGFSALAAADARRGVELFEENGSEIRGLVTGIDLAGGMDGWTLAREAREQLGGLPVVYISGASVHHWASHGVPNSLMIAKPFAAAQVVVALSSLMTASDSTP
jgi:DNA-binding response OmpR family regulator